MAVSHSVVNQQLKLELDTFWRGQHTHGGTYTHRPLNTDWKADVCSYTHSYTNTHREQSLRRGGTQAEASGRRKWLMYPLHSLTLLLLLSFFCFLPPSSPSHPPGLQSLTSPSSPAPLPHLFLPSSSPPLMCLSLSSSPTSLWQCHGVQSELSIIRLQREPLRVRATWEWAEGQCKLWGKGI